MEFLEDLDEKAGGKKNSEIDLPSLFQKPCVLSVPNKHMLHLHRISISILVTNNNDRITLVGGVSLFLLSL